LRVLYLIKFKIVLAGAKNVGKSSLIARYCDNVFDENMMDTIGVAFKRKKLNLEDNLPIELTIWDFGGEEKYRSLFPQYVKGAIAALILYDTTRSITLDDVHNWVDIVDAYGDQDILKLLIGTKIDLVDKKEITKENATKDCAKYKWCGEIIETSAKTGENVEEAFINVIREIVSIKFQKCEACGDYFSKKLKFCSNCGEKAELEASS
jgi:small GTP-binding protein